MPHAIRIHETGGPEVLKWEEVEVGEPGPGQVKLRQEAAGLNFIDVYHRTGLYKQELPFIPGTEGAGVVESLGEGVTNLKAGDRVAYAGPIGGYAEKRLIPAERLVKLPGGVSTELAAAIMRCWWSAPRAGCWCSTTAPTGCSIARNCAITVRS